MAGGQILRVSDELQDVEQLMGTTSPLVAVLTDTAVPRDARRAVVEDLLQERVSPATLRLVVRIIMVERASDLMSALHDVAELAHLNRDAFGADVAASEEALLGRLAGRHLAAGYAAALFETLHSVHDLEEIEDELFRFARIVESSPELRSALSDRTVAVAQRRHLVEDLLGGRASATSRRLVGEALVRGRDVVGMLDWLVEQAAVARGWRVARVRAARAVDPDERRRLAEVLGRMSGVPVELQVTLDSSLLGGVVIQIGDLLLDASAVHRLEQLEEHLLGGEETTRGAHT
jgi:F-type H+-transporting ATPase subunit delta